MMKLLAACHGRNWMSSNVWDEHGLHNVGIINSEMMFLEISRLIHGEAINARVPSLLKQSSARKKIAENKDGNSVG